MLPTHDLAATLPSLPLHSYGGLLFRAVHYDALLGLHSPTPYAPDPLFCGAAAIRGARYTPVGGMASLYLAEQRATADSEANQINLAFPGQGITISPPVVLFSATVHLSTVLDLMDLDVRRALGTTLRELKAPWRLRQKRGLPVPTQDLSMAAFDSGCVQALRYPSAVVPGGTCFVIYCDRLASTGTIRVEDAHGNFLQSLP